MFVEVDSISRVSGGGVNVNVSMKSGMARIGGSKIPSPIRPALRLSSARRRA
jgi:hypothetical protein